MLLSVEHIHQHLLLECARREEGQRSGCWLPWCRRYVIEQQEEKIHLSLLRPPVFNFDSVLTLASFCVYCRRTLDQRYPTHANCMPYVRTPSVRCGWPQKLGFVSKQVLPYFQQFLKFASGRNQRAGLCCRWSGGWRRHRWYVLKTLEGFTNDDLAFWLHLEIFYASIGAFKGVCRGLMFKVRSTSHGAIDFGTWPKWQGWWIGYRI